MVASSGRPPLTTLVHFFVSFPFSDHKKKKKEKKKKKWWPQVVRGGLPLHLSLIGSYRKLEYSPNYGQST